MVRVTPAMLSEATGRPVSTVAQTLLGHFTCELLKLVVGFSDGPTQTMVLKRPKSEPGQDPMTRELRFYEHFGAGLTASPQYLGYVEEIDGILLEWLPDLRHFDWRAGPDEAHARAALEALADLHRLDPSLDPSTGAWLQSIDEGWAYNAAAEFDEAWAARQAMLAEFCPDFVALGDRLVGRTGPALAGLATPGCLLHGDAHGENLPARHGGGVCVLDWQDPMIGSPGVDVADFILMSYEIADRRKLTEQMIDVHARRFAQAGYDSIAGYRLGALQRVVRTVRSAHRFPDWAQSSLPWVFDRCATGALDADVGELVE